MQLLLIGILGVVTLALVVMAASQWRRRVAWRQAATECSLKFSSQDIFDLVRRYAGFALMQAGHSAYADNVIHGKLSGWSFRAFDYRFEAGHGPQRVTRRYCVVAAETPLYLAGASVWRDVELDSPAGLTSTAAPQETDWGVAGDAEAAAMLTGCWPAEGSQAIWMQAAEGVVLFATPDRLGGGKLRRQLRAVTTALDRLTEQAGLAGA